MGGNVEAYYEARNQNAIDEITRTLPTAPALPRRVQDGTAQRISGPPLIGPGSWPPNGWMPLAPSDLPFPPAQPVITTITTGTTADPNTPAALETAAVKYDGLKVRYDLIPPGPISELAALFTVGAVKYDDNNWRKGFRWGRSYAAAMRHIELWRAGEEIDPETGIPHLICGIWNLLVLREFELTNGGIDDRPKNVGRVLSSLTPEQVEMVRAAKEKLMEATQ